MSAISNRKNIHDPKSTKPPLDSSARLPASHRNHLGKVHGKSEERYTNIMENCFSQAAQRTRRVKRWTEPKMILRWTAAALLWAERNFRRIKGCEQLKDLEKVLRKLEATSTLKAA